MIGYIEIWRVLILVAHMFCLGGSVFTSEEVKKLILGELSVVFGTIFILSKVI